jgi:predicted small lipoprotein YifL
VKLRGHVTTCRSEQVIMENSLMTHFAHRASRLALLAIPILLVLSACGTKGPVRPLEESLPAAPRNLRIHQQGESFLVSWDAPVKNQDGTSAGDVDGFLIYRGEFPAEAGCPTCREPTDLVAKIKRINPVAASQVRHRFYWRDLNLSAGNGYRYRIVAVTSGGHPGQAALASQILLTPPAPPGQVQVIYAEGQVVLSWTPPARLPERAKLVGYNLYRRSVDRPLSVVPVNDRPLKEPQLRDQSLEPGRSFEYRISTLVTIDGNLLESPLSEAIPVTLPSDG